MTARELHYGERRLRRIAVRMDAARGEHMNLAWLHWSAEWLDLHEQICGRDDGKCSHG